MESIGSTTIPGFLCRLCKKVNRYVIPLPGDRGQSMQLVEKLETLFLINLSAEDNHPKTICQDCIKMVQKNVKHRLKLKTMISAMHPEHKVAGDRSSSPGTDDSTDSSSDLSDFDDLSECSLLDLSVTPVPSDLEEDGGLKFF